MEKTVEIELPLQSHRIAVNTPHNPEFTFDSTAGADDDCLVMCFRTEARILTSDGMETLRPGDCMIHAHAFRRFHTSIRGVQEGFRNDWFYINSTFFLPFLKKSGLPCNRLIPTGKPGLLAEHIHNLTQELSNPDEFSEEAIGYNIAMMLLSIKREHTLFLRKKTEMTRSQRYYCDAFRHLQEKIRREAERDFRIRDLAAEVNLSEERFNVLYHELFGTTPYREIIAERLIRAKRLLAATNMSLKEIAGLCGWQDVHYFSRLFRQKEECTPGEFRKKSGRTGCPEKHSRFSDRN